MEDTEEAERLTPDEQAKNEARNRGWARDIMQQVQMENGREQQPKERARPAMKLEEEQSKSNKQVWPGSIETPVTSDNHVRPYPKIYEPSRASSPTRQEITGMISYPKGPKIQVPKMPSEPTNIEDYFVAFERIAQMYGWPERSWVSFMMPYMNDRAIAVQAVLSDEDATCYDILKEAILESYDMTEDAYRKSFMECARFSWENFKDYAARIEKTFDRWLHAAQVQTSYARLRQLIMKDKFYKSIPAELRALLKDRILTKFIT